MLEVLRVLSLAKVGRGLEGVVREEFQMGLAQKAAKRSAAVPLQIPQDVLFSRAGFGTRFLPEFP